MLDSLLKIFEIISISYGSIWFNRWLEKRNKKKENDMTIEFNRKKKILPILEDVRYQIDGDRVCEWVFSNGDTTFTGHHLKKVSILIEANKEGFPDIGHHFQLLPAKKFERALDKLYGSSDDYVVFNELEYDDDQANLHKLFDLNYIVIIKIRDEINRWVGNLVVSFAEPKEISDSEIAFLKAQASRIGSLK